MPALWDPMYEVVLFADGEREPSDPLAMSLLLRVVWYAQRVQLEVN